MERPLFEILERLGEVRSLDQLLPFVLSKATALFSADRALFAICDPAGRIRRVVRHNMPNGDGGRLPYSNGLIESVLAEREMKVIGNTLEDLDFSNSDSVRFNHIRSMMGAPVMGPVGLLGVIYIDSTSNKTFGPMLDRARVFRALASTVSLALQYVQALEEQRYRDRFTAHVFHNVRNNLQIATTLTHSLMRRVDDLEMLEDLQVINGELGRVETMSNSVLDLYKVETQSTELIWINPAVEIRLRARLFNRFAETVTGRQLQVDVAEAPMALTDSARFGMVIDELLLNAIKYSGPHRPVTVTVRPIAPGAVPPQTANDPRHRLPQHRPAVGTQFVRFSVSNANRTGPISPDKLDRLFEPFVRDKEEGEEQILKSSGLGLSVVREIVVSLGGQIRADSDRDRTTFSVFLPTRIEAA